jgi:hypothetical protein
VEKYRKDAKRLARAVRGGDTEARVRAGRVVGDRVDERFRLSDAQHVLAVEHGYRTWAELVHAETVEERVVESGLAYVEGEPVRVLLRKRGSRLQLGDGGRAVELAGRPPSWRDIAERLVERERGLNVSRHGVVFVPAIEGRCVEELLHRVAAASLALYQELLDVE